MGKVLLVEDDNNLREIFEMRLQAEGHQTLHASDGEEALVVATREKPDLIIADIMMPKLSGFEMLENLRAVPDMKDVKVIMMTALGQAEDRARGEKLGVVKYLVKSQVTLEDFIRVVREVLPSPSSQTTIKKQESERLMQDDNTNPTPPAGDSSPPAAPPAGPSPGGDTTPAPAGDQPNSFASKPPAGDPAPMPDEPASTPSSDPAPMSGVMGSPSSSMPSSDMPPAEPAPPPPADGSPGPGTEEPPQQGGPTAPPPTPGV